MTTHIFVAIDVGSFELELSICGIPTKNGIRQIDHLHHTIALRKNTYNTGRISYELMNEICRILVGLKFVVDTYQVETYRTYVTGAVREAKDNQIILDQILVRTNIKIKIVNNSEQCLLNYRAVAAGEAELNKIIRKGVIAVGVSSGNVQISLSDKDTSVSTQDMEVGTLRLRELLSRTQAEIGAQYSLMEELVGNELVTFRKIYLENREIKGIVDIGKDILYLFHTAGGSEV